MMAKIDLAINLNVMIPHVGEDVEPLGHCRWDVKCRATLNNGLAASYEEKHTLTTLTIWTSAPFLVTYSREMKTYVHKKNAHSILSTIAPSWKQPRCSSTSGWIHTFWNILSVEYYSAIRSHEPLIHTRQRGWILKTLRFGKEARHTRLRAVVFHLYGILNRKTIQTENRRVVARGWQEGDQLYKRAWANLLGWLGASYSFMVVVDTWLNLFVETQNGTHAKGKLYLNKPDITYDRRELGREST